MVAFIIVAFLLICLGADAVIQLKKYREAANQTVASIHPVNLDVKKLIIPMGLHFDKTHTWAFMDKYGKVRMGVDDFLQHITGPITNIKLKNPGEKVKKGDWLLSIIQNGKQLDIYSPLSGRISSYNHLLTKNSSTINSSPYTDGWIYNIEPDNWQKETKLMFIADKAKEWLKNELIRLKDFLTVIQSNKLEYANVVLQDGGAIKDNVLSDFGPEMWEEFQTNFIDNK
ncbi:MAG: hypothetical protein GXO79_15475 [Chlorobi bacterium]|nr:hypothetical protein [Chlorobiota bacterium]